MEIHRIPWKCVKSVISVEFQISSGTHLRNTKESLRLSRVLASGPGRLDLHKNHEEVQNSRKSMPPQQKTRRTYRLSCFHGDLVLFASSARNHGIPIGLLRFLRCHFQQNQHFHGNRDFLWKSQISMKITGFHQKPRFSRKCWFRRKARLENTKKRLRL